MKSSLLMLTGVGVGGLAERSSYWMEEITL